MLIYSTELQKNHYRYTRRRQNYKNIHIDPIVSTKKSK